MSERDPFFKIFVGVPKSGKTWTEMRLTSLSDRVLIIPSSNSEDTFFKECEKPVRLERPTFTWEQDESHPRKRHRKVWSVPNLHTYQGNIQLDMNVFRDKQEKRELRDYLMGPYGFKNGLFIMDDFHNYIKSTTELPEIPEIFFKDYRKRMVDIILSAHRFSDVNALFVDLECSLVIFKTTRPPTDTFLDKLASDAKANELLETIKRVNNQCEIGTRRFEIHRAQYPGKAMPLDILQQKHYFEEFFFL